MANNNRALTAAPAEHAERVVDVVSKAFESEIFGDDDVRAIRAARDALEDAVVANAEVVRRDANVRSILERVAEQIDEEDVPFSLGDEAARRIAIVGARVAAILGEESDATQ